MLNVAKLGAGQERYYLDSVASGVEDYYLGNGEEPGQWTGRGSELLALDGIPGAGPLELVADDLFGQRVGVADQAQVWLGLHHQIVGPKTCHRDRLHRIGKHVSKAQVIIVGRHAATLAALGSNRE